MTVGATYKQTGLDWMPEVPEHWVLRKIKYCVSLNTNESAFEASKFKIALENIESWTGKFVKTEGEAFEGKGKLFRKGDVLFNKLRPYLAKVYLAKTDGICVGELLVLTPNITIVSQEYLFYRLLSKSFIDIVNSSTYGAKMPRANWNFIGNLKIPIPPKDEQNEIVQYIKAQEEKINLFIQKKQRFIELLKEQRQSKIDEAVDGTNKNWLNKKLKYIAEIKFSNVDKHTIEDEIPVRLCNYVDVYKNDYITNDLELMNATATETEIEKFTVLKGDVIITKDSEEATDIAVPTFVKEHLENVVCGYHLALIRANENEILNEYLFRKFQSSELKAYFAIEATGVTRVGLSMGEITGVKISYPKSIEEQRKIVLHIKTETATIDTAIAKAELEIELIREYKEAMISEAVMGKRNR